MEINDIIALYKTVGHRNADYLFRFLHDIHSKSTLSCVDPNIEEILAKDKTLLVAVNVLVDDVADNSAFRDRSTLDQCIQIPWSAAREGENKYAALTREIWTNLAEAIRKYPRFEEFRGWFNFDMRQFFSSVDYSFLINTTDIGSEREEQIYTPHNVVVMPAYDMDLMCSPKFAIGELRQMRDVAHLAQKVIYIGNMINTYSKDFAEGDYSNPLIAGAIRKGLVQRGELPDEHILRALEAPFKNEAARLLQEISESTLQSVDVGKIAKDCSKAFKAFLNQKPYWKSP